MSKYAFVGPGRTGLALGSALIESDSGIFLRYYGRRPDPPEHPLFTRGVAEYVHELDQELDDVQVVLLTVPDANLPQAVDELADRGQAPPSGCVVIHCSGAMDVDVLAPLSARGYVVGTLHPLQSISRSPGGPRRFRGAYFAVSGTHEALAVTRRIIDLLGGRSVEVPPGLRPMYHAASVLASNYVVALLNDATRIMERCGVSRGDATKMITSLASGVLENLRSLDFDDALTGPLIRGDVDTVAAHLRALEPEEAILYAALGRRVLDWVGGRLESEDRIQMGRLFEDHA